MHNGTVHAPDAEIALLNARDVFARRPQAHAMWVVLNDHIFTKTHEQIVESAWDDASLSGGDEVNYCIFGKSTQQGQLEQLGSQAGTSAQSALRDFIEAYSGKNIWFWWSFPASAVTSTEENEADSFFRPFEEHAFKDQAHYPVLTMMREIKAKGKQEG